MAISWADCNVGIIGKALQLCRAETVNNPYAFRYIGCILTKPRKVPLCGTYRIAQAVLSSYKRLLTREGAVLLENCKARLEGFLTLNPFSEIQEIEDEDKKYLAIVNPWGDESVAILIKEDDEKIFSVLNNTYLPERFSAIWHPKDEALEFIWSVFPAKSEVADRKFTFRFKGIDYECYFAPSSDQLLTIGRAAHPTKPSKTDFRNLTQFAFLDAGEGPWQHDIGPRSFWIRNVQWNEDVILPLVHHLNFYMSYYDMGTPLILIHTPKSEDKASKPRTRYIEGSFPKQIEGRLLDENLLHFWQASLKGDPARRFLYCYRMIEYASLSYLDNKTRTSVRRILASPTMSLNIDSVTPKIVAAISNSKLEEVPRIQAFLEDTVDPELVWKEVERNIEAFSSITIFDGGYEIAALIKGAPQDRKASFLTAWPVAFHSTLRNIRNGLSHGRDQKSAMVIAPTTANYNKLQPWVAALSIVASQAVVYQGIV